MGAWTLFPAGDRVDKRLHTLDFGVVGRMPWPRLKMCPRAPRTDSSRRAVSRCTIAGEVLRSTGSRLPWRATRPSFAEASRAIFRLRWRENRRASRRGRPGRRSDQRSARGRRSWPAARPRWAVAPLAKRITGETSRGSAATMRRIHCRGGRLVVPRRL